MLERKIIVFLFGKEGARNLIIYLNEHTTQIADSQVAYCTGSFGGELAKQSIKTTYGDLTELIDGDHVLFVGLRALLSVVICTELLSQNRVQVARQNVAKQPLSSKTTTKREEAEVVQSLASTARSIIYALDDYLRQEGKNPLDLKVKNTITITRYSTNTSGKLPSNIPFTGFLR